MDTTLKLLKARGLVVGIENGKSMSDEAHVEDEIEDPIYYI